MAVPASDRNLLDQLLSSGYRHEVLEGMRRLLHRLLRDRTRGALEAVHLAVDLLDASCDAGTGPRLLELKQESRHGLKPFPRLGAVGAHQLASQRRLVHAQPSARSLLSGESGVIRGRTIPRASSSGRSSY